MSMSLLRRSRLVLAVSISLIASASSQIWQTEDCLAAIEIESTAPTGSWQLQSNHGGFTGTGYVCSAPRPRASSTRARLPSLFLLF